MKRLVLIDSNALVHRAFHALPPLSSPTGQPTNAVYGFTSVLLKMIADLKPDYIVATFDLAGPTFRHEAYEHYKAHRVKAPDELYAQIPAVKQMLAAFGIPVLELAGFEADDIIGTVSKQTQDLPDIQTVIVTGDMDTLQLVHDNKVVVFTLRKGMSDTIIYDEDGVRERLGVTPEQVPDLKGLKGDASDNIPGVKGIGEKTATALIQTFGTIEALYRELERPGFSADKKKGVSEKTREKLLAQKEAATFSKTLAVIIRDVPVVFDLSAADWRDHLNMPAIEKVSKDLGFYSLIKRIHTTLDEVTHAAATQPLSIADTADGASVTPLRIRKPTALPVADTAAFHGLFENGTLKTLWVTTDGKAVYEITLPTPQMLFDALLRYRTILGHDIKPLLKQLPNELSWNEHVFIDTSIAAWLINPELREYGLERVYYETLEQTPDPSNEATPFAIWHLWPALEKRLRSIEALGIFTNMEMPLLPILAAMERRGIRVDLAHIDELMRVASKEVSSLEEKIYKLAGRPFNINSPAQLSDILFTTLGLRGRVRRTGGGAPSTAAAELEKLRDEHPIIELILQYRELNKLKTTYIEPFPTLTGADGRIHTTYNQTGTATGRLSSSDPNLQNIPTRTELGQQFRSTFLPSEGYQLLSLDYSQLELRLVAHMAHDETMIEAFRAGEDIHTRTASEIFGIAPIQVDRDMRRQAKVLNFGIIYGMGSMGFARAAGVDRTAAKRFIDEYFVRFAGVARYMEHTKEEAYRQGYVSTLLGRRRPLPDMKSTIPQMAAQAERMAINHPIQGTGADLMKLAMIRIDDYIRTQPTDAIRMLLQVHDEFVFEVTEPFLERAARDIAHIMETVHPLDVPLVADAKSGPNWADMKPL